MSAATPGAQATLDGLTDAQRFIAADMSEARLEANIKDAVEKLNGRYYHTRNSRGSVEGWPDDAIWLPHRPDVLLLSENKAMRGVWSKYQLEWREVLRYVKYLEYYDTWTPETLLSGEIEEALLRGRRGRK